MTNEQSVAILRNGIVDRTNECGSWDGIWKKENPALGRVSFIKFLVVFYVWFSVEEKFGRRDWTRTNTSSIAKQGSRGGWPCFDTPEYPGIRVNVPEICP